MVILTARYNAEKEAVEAPRMHYPNGQKRDNADLNASIVTF